MGKGKIGRNDPLRSAATLKHQSWRWCSGQSVYTKSITNIALTILSLLSLQPTLVACVPLLLIFVHLVLDLSKPTGVGKLSRTCCLSEANWLACFGNCKVFGALKKSTSLEEPFPVTHCCHNDDDDRGHLESQGAGRG